MEGGKIFSRPRLFHMRFYTLILSFFVIINLSCNRWEYNDLSKLVESVSPETHLSLVALDTIWVAPQIDQNGDTTLLTALSLPYLR